ncbi:unnamed protein product [Aphanomyces euteiches]|uniref:B30.2/SPRY domain-containing protein n=1 Tax=Aphanomyces euteiches TaxID=100861 RepID=A0A6G0WI87_9STRA|nr:hypothetical protein Ae201684_014911 [Aphanomyces euteiches]KAH9076700.1 hypothetical protein Ae201684P_010635 [Aphanomyces euteiches]KAH9153840.1 hypothetical protein AeRB84_003973 [Aphanomyces euteiches]
MSMTTSPTAASLESNPVAKELVLKMKETCAASQKQLEKKRQQLLDLQAAQKAVYQSIVQQIATADAQIDEQLRTTREDMIRYDHQAKHFERLLAEQTAAEKNRQHQAKRQKTETPRPPPPHVEIAALGNRPFVASPRWDLERCGQFGCIINLGRTVRTTGEGWNVVIAKEPADHFTVRLTLPPTLRHPFAIGFTREPNFWKIPVINPPRIFAYHKTGWFLNAQKGSLCSRDGHEDEPFVDPLQSDDVLTVAYDYDLQTIGFKLNGKPLGDGPSFQQVKDLQLYPAIVSYDEDVEVEFVVDQ